MMKEKICQNMACQKPFTPTTPQVAKRQKYCQACVGLPTKQRRRGSVAQPRLCQNPACGKVFMPRPNMVDTQKYCTVNCRLEHIRTTNRAKSSYNRKDKKRIEALCPNCRIIHTVILEWDQSIMPRIFCPSCNQYRTSEAFAGQGLVDIVTQACLS